LLSQLSRSHEALQGFRAKLAELSGWIEGQGFEYLRRSAEFGGDLESCSTSLAEHRDLFNRAHLKMFELEGLRLASSKITLVCRGA
jgi:hypothetical protein